jgi:hypothetical protein
VGRGAVGDPSLFVEGALAADPEKITSSTSLLQLAQNALGPKHNDRALAGRCVARIGELAVVDAKPGLYREFARMLAIGEAVKRLHGNNHKMTYTRRMVAVGDDKSAGDAIRRLVERDDETDGFRLLVEGGCPEVTCEAIVVRWFNAFPAETVEKAKARLIAAGVDTMKMSLPAEV